VIEYGGIRSDSAVRVEDDRKKRREVWVHHFIVSNLPEDDLLFET